MERSHIDSVMKLLHRLFWSLFIRFKKRRLWGFWPKGGFIDWRKWWSDLCDDQPSTEWTDPKSWGREITRKDGYVLVHCPIYPGKTSNKGHVLKHRLVVAASLKRPLTSDECVHHINGDKTDNSLGNLQVLTNSELSSLREAKLSKEQKTNRAKKASRAAVRVTRKPRTLVPCACGCGEYIENFDTKGRKRSFKRGHNNRNKKWKWSKKGE